MATTEIRYITEDEFTDFRKAVHYGFGDDTDGDADGAVERSRAVFPLETCIAAFDRGRVVGTFGSFDFDVTLPGGGSLPMAGTTIVTVHPTHRRRGILTTMMRMHLKQAIDRGQPVAGLWASESKIYGRFGYGNAVTGQELSFSSAVVDLPGGPDDVAVYAIDEEAAASVLPPIYERVRPTVSGYLSRSEAWWTNRRIWDPQSSRSGMSARRYVIAERNQEHVGYVLYRQKENWEGFESAGKVSVIEIVAVDDDVRRSLWHYLAGIDLFDAITWWNAPIDEPVVLEVDNPRKVTRKPYDTLWLRVLDVATCVTARRYEADGSIVVGITDSFLDVTTGTYRIEVTGGVATCEPTEAPAEVTMGVSQLGALLLGGTDAIALHRARRLEGDSESVGRLDRLFRTASAPWIPEVF